MTRPTNCCAKPSPSKPLRRTGPAPRPNSCRLREPRSKAVRQPGQFNITSHPNPHLAFGHGIHACLGATLARMESRIALADFLDRVRGFERATDGPWEPRAA